MTDDPELDDWYRRLHAEALERIASGQVDEMVNRVLREADIDTEAS